MKKKVFAVIVLMCLSLSACSMDIPSPLLDDLGGTIEPFSFVSPIVTGESQPTTVESGTAESSSSAPVSSNENETQQFPVYDGLPATITERYVKDGKMQSYLTGEWKDYNTVLRRNIAVMIPNNLPALPQYGLSAASIIYEAPVEGRITRLMGIFEDYDQLDHIGPVRSSRDYYVYEAMAFDSIYVNWGLAVLYVGELINSDRIDNVSQTVAGIDVPAPEAFGRIEREGYATEFTGYLFTDGLEAAIDRLGYDKDYRETFNKPFTFASDGHRAFYEEYPSATLICPGGTSKNKGGYGDALPYFEYNSTDGLYYRYEYGGPQTDEMNGEQLKVSNVIFKICHGEVRDDHDYLAFGVHGEGSAIVFTAGRAIKCTWKRESDEAATKYYDKDGNEIIFNQGKTWICNVWKEYADCMYYR